MSGEVSREVEDGIRRAFQDAGVFSPTREERARMWRRIERAARPSIAGIPAVRLPWDDPNSDPLGDMLAFLPDHYRYGHKGTGASCASTGEGRSGLTAGGGPDKA